MRCVTEIVYISLVKCNVPTDIHLLVQAALWVVLFDTDIGFENHNARPQCTTRERQQAHALARALAGHYVTPSDALRNSTCFFTAHKNRHSEFTKPAHKYELVVARYDEALDWVRKEPFDSMQKSIYLKDNDLQRTIEIYEDLPASTRFQVLNNTGNEGHTFLTHIVSHWDHLAEHTIFSQGSPLPQGENMSRIVQGIMNCLSQDSSAPCTEYYNGYRAFSGVFPPQNYITLQKPFEQFTQPINFLQLFRGRFPSVAVYSSGAYCMVSRDRIRRHSHNLYRELLGVLSGKYHEPGGYAMEKLWTYLFDTEILFQFDEEVHCRCECMPQAIVGT
jgi:hypothetical protein